MTLLRDNVRDCFSTPRGVSSAVITLDFGATPRGGSGSARCNLGMRTPDLLDVGECGGLVRPDLTRFPTEWSTKDLRERPDTLPFSGREKEDMMVECLPETRSKRH